MAKFLSEIRKRCRENFIVQFLLPHILVVVLMIFVMRIGVDKALYIVRMDTENSYVSMLRHSVRIIDHELYKIERAALQISREENVRNLAAYQETDKNQIDTALKALDHTGEILNFQNSGLLSETYVFFRTKNRILQFIQFQFSNLHLIGFIYKFFLHIYIIYWKTSLKNDKIYL